MTGVCITIACASEAGVREFRTRRAPGLYVNNIRYITSTKIGELVRDKLSCWAVLTRTGEPILWDFSSASLFPAEEMPIANRY